MSVSIRNETDLLAVLQGRYGLAVTATVQMKTVTGIVTDMGDSLIWKLAGPGTDERRLQFLHETLGGLAAQGVDVAHPLPNRSGVYLTVLHDHSVGYLQRWLPGRHVNVTVKQERIAAMEAVAHMHAAVPAPHWLPFDASAPSTPLLRKLLAKRQSLQQAWPVACENLPELVQVQDEVFRAMDAACAAIQKAPPSRMGAAGDGVPSGAGSGLVFCHRDLAPHNLLWQPDKAQIAMIDFDLAGYDDPFADIAQWANHYLFLGDPKPGDILALVTTYRDIRPWHATRDHALWSLLGFPDILVRATLEWVKGGCLPQRRHRVHAALDREALRRRIRDGDGQRFLM